MWPYPPVNIQKILMENPWNSEVKWSTNGATVSCLCEFVGVYLFHLCTTVILHWNGYIYVYIYICISDTQLFQWIYDSQYRIFAPMDACYNVLIFLSTEFNILLVASSNKPIFHGSKFDGPLKLSILIVMFSIHPKNIPKTILQDIP